MSNQKIYKEIPLNLTTILGVRVEDINNTIDFNPFDKTMPISGTLRINSEKYMDFVEAVMVSADKNGRIKYYIEDEMGNIRPLEIITFKHRWEDVYIGINLTQNIKITNVPALDSESLEYIAQHLSAIIFKHKNNGYDIYKSDIEGYYTVEIFTQPRGMIVLGTFDFQEFEIIA